MIEFRNLEYTYRSAKTPILSDISLSLAPGETLGVLGKNGSGKSTLANIAAGILSTNNVFLDDLPLKSLQSNKLRQRIGIVFQNPDAQTILSTPREDITFAMQNLQGFSDNNAIEKALELVGAQALADCEIFELSLGQKQRIALASALVTNPDYLVLDEVTSMLDTDGKYEVIEIIASLKAKSVGILMVTNNIDEIASLDNAIFVENGHISEKFSVTAEDFTMHLKRFGFKLTPYWKLRELAMNDSQARKVYDKICEN